MKKTSRFATRDVAIVEFVHSRIVDSMSSP